MSTKTSATEKLFETYTSSLAAHKVIRPDGKVIHFIRGQLITDNAEDIAYLDEQIKKGALRWLTKGKAVTASDADPMAALRRKIEEDAIAKYIAAQKAAGEASGIVETESSSDKPVLTPASTSALARLTGNSNSGQ